MTSQPTYVGTQEARRISRTMPGLAAVLSALWRPGLRGLALGAVNCTVPMRADTNAPLLHDVGGPPILFMYLVRLFCLAVVDQCNNEQQGVHSCIGAYQDNVRERFEHHAKRVAIVQFCYRFLESLPAHEDIWVCGEIVLGVEVLYFMAGNDTKRRECENNTV